MKNRYAHCKKCGKIVRIHKSGRLFWHKRIKYSWKVFCDGRYFNYNLVGGN